MAKKIKDSNESGQSTIEFLLTFTTAVGFIFVFLKMAMNYTDGYMVHHATYMAARSYMVQDQDRDDVNEGDKLAKNYADTVFTKYLPEGLVNGVSAADLKENGPELSETKYRAFVGLYIKYVQRFSLGMIGGTSNVDFISEAFLGREPTRAETKAQTCAAIKSLGLNRCDIHVTLEDNGG